MTQRLNEIPERVLNGQLGYFATVWEARAFIREKLFEQLKSWVEVNKRMRDKQYGKYKIYVDMEFDEGTGDLIEDYGCIVYI